MTDQELRRLRRSELLEMMIRQGQQMEAEKQKRLDAEQTARELEETLERLKKKLDHKDSEILQQNQTYQRLRQIGRASCRERV